MIDIKTPFTYKFDETCKEPVLHGDMVRPDMSMTIREIIDRFTRGVPAVGVANMQFDEDAQSLFDAPYVFPDFPDFADYVFAEQYLQRSQEMVKLAMEQEMSKTTDGASATIQSEASIGANA